MRKFRKWANAMLAVAAVASLTACDDEKENELENQVPAITQGMLVLNNGNMGKNIEGDITYYDYATSKAYQDMFQRANKRSLGNTPQCAIIYGSKMYIGVYKSEVVEVVDRYTMKSLKQIRLEGSEATQPRSMVAKDGKVYISMYTGYVSRLDTVACEIDASVKVGPNPDVIGIHGDKLYVPNSNGMGAEEGYGKTATEIDLASFTTTKTFEVPLNPTKFITCGGDLYVLCMGDYNEILAALYHVDATTYETEKVMNATMMASHDSKLYVIDFPFQTKIATYSIYDTKTGKTASLLKDSKDAVDAPAGIQVDPITGDIFITSYVMDGGKAGYALPGYCKIYDRNGVYKSRFETGVGPTFLFPSLN